MKKIPVISSCLECPFLGHKGELNTKYCNKLFRFLPENVVLYSLIDEDCPLPEYEEV